MSEKILDRPDVIAHDIWFQNPNNAHLKQEFTSQWMRFYFYSMEISQWFYFKGAFHQICQVVKPKI